VRERTSGREADNQVVAGWYSHGTCIQDPGTSKNDVCGASPEYMLAH
jgi:hypothetical protein